VFKLGIGNDLGISYGMVFGVERSKVKVRVRVNSNTSVQTLRLPSTF